jgi:5-methyltetrahydropteroyltriglutamate--homocysteine methyltransferase
MPFQVLPTLTGLHSRSEDTVRVSRDYERARTTDRNLAQTFRTDAGSLIGLELESGFSGISDGQLKWQDFIRPFSESLQGMKSGADLSRWFDTNTFYKKPTVVGKLRFADSASFIAGSYSEKAAFRSSGVMKNKKVAIPGPFTLASLVDDSFYGSRPALIREFAKILRSVLASLPKSGYSCVQINEPSLVYRYGDSAVKSKEDFEDYLDAFSKNLSKCGIEIYLHTYFGDSAKILKDLLELPGVSTIGIDFTQTSLSELHSMTFKDKALGCGCVNGRNSLIETPEWISDFCQSAVNSLRPSGLVIFPSCDLKYLPRVHADEKVRAIGRAARILRERRKQ